MTANRNYTVWVTIISKDSVIRNVLADLVELNAYPVGSYDEMVEWLGCERTAPRKKGEGIFEEITWMAVDLAPENPIVEFSCALLTPVPVSAFPFTRDEWVVVF